MLDADYARAVLGLGGMFLIDGLILAVTVVYFRRRSR